MGIKLMYTWEVFRRAGEETWAFAQDRIFWKLFFIVVITAVRAFVLMWRKGKSIDSFVLSISYWDYIVVPIFIGAGAALVVFLGYCIKAQYKMWDDAKKNFNMLKRLSKIGEYAPDEQPLSVAVEYIRNNTNFGKGKRSSEIREEILTRVNEGDIQLQGICSRPQRGPNNQYLGRQMDTYRIEIPVAENITYRYCAKYGEPQRPAIEIIKETNDPIQNFFNRFNPNIYYDPVVSMAQIKEQFGNIES